MPPATAAPPRKQIDDDALADELRAEKGPDSEEDGLGPAGDPPAAPPASEPPTEITQEEYDDPNSEHNTGVPGGRQPGDDGYVEPESEGDPPTGEEPPSPPTPPADLPHGEGDNDPEPEASKPKDEPLGIIGDRELGLKVGGRKPDSATLHLKGGKIELRGPKGSQFDRGDRFLTVSTLQITGDNDQDTIVKDSGEVSSTSKKQNATLCGITRLEDWLAGNLREFEEEDQVARIFAGLDLELPERED